MLLPVERMLRLPRPSRRRGRRSHPRGRSARRPRASGGRTESPGRDRSRVRAARRAGCPTRSLPRSRGLRARGRADEVRGDRGVLGLLVDALHERPVDLDHVHQEAAQLRERREAGAEVVDRDAHAVVVQQLELRPRTRPARSFLDEARLRHLQAEALRREAGVLECRPHSPADPAADELAAREVHPRDEPLGQEPVLPPPRRLGARLAEHELAEPEDQPGRLGDAEEPVRRNEAAARRVPADERLDADDLALSA